MMRLPLLLLATALLLSTQAFPHFLVLRPSTDVAGTTSSSTELMLDISFTHPMENGPVMDMATPRRFGVLVNGESRDLLESLAPVSVQGKQTFAVTYTIDAPGAHVFYVEPAPYWEPAEKRSIIHYTKVVVEAYGRRSGWDAMVGLPVEIEPLTRPYGLWTGNVFQGIVRKNGEPVPFTTVEIEYLNEDGVVPPNDAFITQVVKTDANGMFTYALPRAGWWGFAALLEGDEKLPGPDGTPADVELGALIWVKATDMKAEKD